MQTLSLRHALRRGAFHASVGVIIATSSLFFPPFTISVALAAVTAFFLSFDAIRLRVTWLNHWFLSWFAPLVRDKERTKLTGSSYFLIACLITVAAFPRHISIPAILFVSLGDSAATVVGVWKGRIRVWGRSVEGHIACLVICLVIGGLLAATSHGLPPIVTVVGAIFATLFEALPLPLNDNITIPVGSALAMTLASLLL